jgi:hypothetical protein
MSATANRNRRFFARPGVSTLPETLSFVGGIAAFVAPDETLRIKAQSPRSLFHKACFARDKTTRPRVGVD